MRSEASSVRYHTSVQHLVPISVRNLSTMTLPWMFITLAIYLPHILAAPAELTINPEGLSPPPAPEVPAASPEKPESNPPPAEPPLEPVSSSPITEGPAPPALPECQNTTDVYDSSQSGTDNYRINVKGFTFLVAPSDTLLGAAMLMGGMDEIKTVPGSISNSDNNKETAPAVRTKRVDKFSKLLHLLKKLNGNERR